MNDRYFAQLADGMDVYDLSGDKLGTVDGLYRPAASVASTAPPHPPTLKPPGGAIFQDSEGDPRLWQGPLPGRRHHGYHRQSRDTERGKGEGHRDGLG